MNNYRGKPKASIGMNMCIHPNHGESINISIMFMDEKILFVNICNTQLNMI
jgi:hypothetical protein